MLTYFYTLTKISSHFTDIDFYLPATFDAAAFVLELIINLLDEYFALLVIFSKRSLITVNGGIAKRQAIAPAAAAAEAAAEEAAVEVTLPEVGAATPEVEDTREEEEDTREGVEDIRVDTPQEEEVAEEVAVEEVRRLSERSRKCE